MPVEKATLTIVAGDTGMFFSLHFDPGVKGEPTPLQDLAIFLLAQAVTACGGTEEDVARAIAEAQAAASKESH